MTILLSDEELQLGGCNSKMPYNELVEMLNASTLAPKDQFEDAPRLSASPHLRTSIDTLSAFTRDAYLYGQVSIVHAITDLHSHGAEPVDCNISLSIQDGVGLEVGTAIIDGTANILRSERIAFGKGHSIRAQRTALTVSVIGRETNSQPSPVLGETYILVMTKPLGAGRVLFTNSMQGLDQPSEELLTIMLQTHRTALDIIGSAISGTADVTGFGLLGAAYQLTQRGVNVIINKDAIPFVHHEALEVPAACDTRANQTALEHKISLSCKLSIRERNLLFGNQIAGPILAIFPESKATQAIEELQAKGFRYAAAIGVAVFGEKPSVIVQ